MKRKHGIWMLFVLGVVFFASVIGSAGGAGGPVVQHDSYGDENGGPDIMSVRLSDSHGVVSLTVNAAGLQITEDSAVVSTFADTMLDIDRNTATGNELGADYAFVIVQDDKYGLSASIWHFVEGGWIEVAPTSTAFTSSADSYTFSFATSELGGASGFDYHVAAGGWAQDGSWVGRDSAPDEGVWTYWPLTTESWEGGGAIAGLPDGTLYLAGNDALWHQIDAATLNPLGLGDTPVTLYAVLPGALGDAITPIVVATPAPTPTPVTQVTAAVVVPVIARPSTTPAKPTAGKTFTLKFLVTRSDTGDKLLDGKMICDPAVTGKVIKHFEQFRNGIATMRFTIPKSAKGKVMKVHLTIKAGGQSATRDLGFRVG